MIAPHLIVYQPPITPTVNDEIEHLYAAAKRYDDQARTLLLESIRIAKLGSAARQEATRLLRAGMGGHL